MKYIAIIDSEEFKDFKFFEDADGKYLAVKDVNAKYDEWLPLHFEALDINGDAVSRHAVIEGLRTCYDTETKDYSDGSQWINYEDAVAEMEALPSITPQHKIGRWSILKDEYGDVVNAVCSCCDKSGNHKWTFCPYCGCKMQGVED